MIETVEIMNLKSLKNRWYWKTKPFDMKIDRSSPVGNPYEIDRDGDRNRVCDRYDREFERLRQIPFFEAYLQSLLRIYKRYGQIRLWCWCAPKRCHGETIKKWLINETQFEESEV